VEEISNFFLYNIDNLVFTLRKGEVLCQNKNGECLDNKMGEVMLIPSQRDKKGEEANRYKEVWLHRKEKKCRLEIIVDILETVSKDGGVEGEGVTKTEVVYGANLNFERAKRYLELLKKHSLIEVVHGSTKYRATGKGKEFLIRYGELEDFGLNFRN
jgi:predicted transcriptional regulator